MSRKKNIQVLERLSFDEFQSVLQKQRSLPAHSELTLAPGIAQTRLRLETSTALVDHS